MRLPCLPDAKNKTHFLTDFYASGERFNLPLARFDNYSKNAFLKFYNEEAVRIKGELYDTLIKSTTKHHNRLRLVLEPGSLLNIYPTLHKTLDYLQSKVFDRYT